MDGAEEEYEFDQMVNLPISLHSSIKFDLSRPSGLVNSGGRISENKNDSLGRKSSSQNRIPFQYGFSGAADTTDLCYSTDGMMTTALNAPNVANASANNLRENRI